MRGRTAAWAIAISIALGALHAASFSPPLDYWWLQTATLAALLAIVRRAGATRPMQAACIAGAFGIGWFASGVSWVYISMHQYGGMPSALAAAALLLFSAYLSLYPAGAMAAWSQLATGTGAQRQHPPAATGPGDPWPQSFLARAASAGAFAGCWGVSEILRGWVFTGFPWLAIGYAHVDGPLAGYAPWIGVYGICIAAALVAALLAEALGGGAPPVERRIAPRLALAGVAAAVLALGAGLRIPEMTAPSGDPVSVRLVQGNVPQQMKFDPVRAIRAMREYTNLVEQSHAQLTVLPETAWVVPWTSTPPDIASRILQAAARSKSVLAIGMPLVEADSGPATRVPRYTNSVALIDPGSAALPAAEQVRGRYDKRHLVPFGEFVPFGFAWFVRLMNIPLGEFGRGAPVQQTFPVAGQRFAFNICYEDLFGEELLASLRGPGGATVLVNVSNLAWFGDTQALPQHLAIARMRALETGRPMLRATNTGVTAAIDHRGRVIARMPVYRHGAIDVTIRGTTGITPYARLGNVSAWLIALALACAPALARAVRRSRTGAGSG